MSWQALAFVGGLVFQAALLVATQKALVRDVNGIGRKYRKLFAELLIDAANDPERVKRLAKLLSE